MASVYARWQLQGCVCSKLVCRGGNCVQCMHHCASRAVVSHAHPIVHTLEILFAKCCGGERAGVMESETVD